MKLIRLSLRLVSTQSYYITKMTMITIQGKVTIVENFVREVDRTYLSVKCVLFFDRKIEFLSNERHFNSVTEIMRYPGNLRSF